MAASNTNSINAAFVRFVTQLVDLNMVDKIPLLVQAYKQKLDLEKTYFDLVYA